MKIILVVAGVVVALCIVFGSYTFANTNTHLSTPAFPQKETSVTHHAHGTFEVEMTPQVPDDDTADSTIGRMSIDKQFYGDLEATSKGLMLAVRTDVEGSAGYVAMERVTGSLDGHRGTFVLQHCGTMTRGVPRLTVTVVPDSGTKALVGLDGKMTINIVDGKHYYDFEYTLEQAQ